MKQLLISMSGFEDWGRMDSGLVGCGNGLRAGGPGRLRDVGERGGGCMYSVWHGGTGNIV